MESCENPLSVWYVDPPAETTGVPTDARVLVGLIGMGTADEAAVELVLGETAISATTETWCYPHEGPDEVHCWISLRATLTADTTYSIRVASTEAWQGTGEIALESRFTTGSAPAEVPAAPVVSLASVADVEDEPCAWDLTRQYRYSIEEFADSLRLGVLQIYDGDALVHTVHSPGKGTFSIKQWRDATLEDDGCYSFVHEATSGARSDAVEVCVPEPVDSGDTAEPVDSGDTAEPEDSAGPVDTADSAVDPETGDPADTGEPAVPVAEDPRCGCRGAAAWLPLLILLGRRRR